MFKESWRTIVWIERAADNICLLIAFVAAYTTRTNINLFAEKPLGPLLEYVPIILVALPTFNIVLNIVGAYESMRLSSPWQIFKRSLVAGVVVFIASAATLYLTKLDLSRSLLILFCAWSAILLTVVRLAVLKLLKYWRTKGRNYRNILISGIGQQAANLHKQITIRPELGIRVVGFLELDNLKHDAETYRRLPVIVGLDNFERSLKQLAIDEVIFTDVAFAMKAVEEAAEICQEEGVRTTVVADIFSTRLVRSEISYFAGLPLLHYTTSSHELWALLTKRSIDLVVSAVALIVLSPIFCLIAIAVKVTSPGRAIFKQQRVGLNGRLFNMYKFRSMFADAESKKAELQAMNEMQGPVFKVSRDPRVTSVGRFIRRFSLDELPQLYNVFRGDMSLVGPRPPLPSEVSQYDRKQRRRLSMRPGITCIWQVNGRNEISDFKSWVELDLQYIDNWSLKSDLKILLQTIPAVLMGAGAK